jgi:hypothetical protein
VPPPRDENAINRVLKARGLGSLDEPGTVAHLAYLVEDHTHFMELLRACDPELRRQMYDDMRPHLRFAAKPLEDYVIAAKEHAEAAQLATLDDQGFLQPFRIGVIELPAVELWVVCSRCGAQNIFLGDRKVDAIRDMRDAGWAFDSSVEARHLCPECLEKVPS